MPNGISFSVPQFGSFPLMNTIYHLSYKGGFAYDKHITQTIFNPAVSKRRLEKLLSLLLNQNVKIIHVLPNDDTRLTAEGSLLIMDILVHLADGSLANIECQKIGYDFPGERCAYYRNFSSFHLTSSRKFVTIKL